VSRRPKTMEEAPLLGVPLPDPPAVHHCAECAALARQREAAREAGDLSGAADCNVQIRRHPHGIPKDS
jgi:hypothetical protein